MAGVRRLARRVAAGAVLGALIACSSAAAQGTDTGNNLPISPEWLSNTLERALTTTEVKNNTIPGAIARRDQAVAAWKDAVARWQGSGKKKANAPDPRAKPEYSVVWSGKQNAADVHGKVLSDLITNATVNPQGILELAGPQFLPGLDGFQVIDVRPINLDGSRNPDYGKVVNFVQLPLPWGVETEAHHMQYEWNEGEPIVAGALFTDVTFVLGAEDIPNLKLKNIVPPQETLGGTIPDAYDAIGDGRFIGTYMGGPEFNFGGSPGEVVVFKPHPEKGLVVESEVPAGNIGGVGLGNANGVPEPCSVREARPLGTCANPHGIQIRQDLTTMVTSDYAEPREIVLDPVKNYDQYAFRPTLRTWDTSNPSKPVLTSVAHMPKSPRSPAQRAHENYGIMENAKTWPAGGIDGALESKGFFAGSMCGGGVFFTPDITKSKGDSSDQWVQVWDDGISNLLAKGGAGEFIDEPGGCAGGAWHQVSRNNKWFFRSVQGRNPNADNYFDQGAVKMLYNLDISPLIKSAQDGKVQCDLSKGIDENGDGSVDIPGIDAYNRLAQGETLVDCPKVISTLIVNDKTSGGPHWGALDNHSLTPDGFPTRLTFSNYFVARTGVDGDHRFYVVDIAPNGELSYDKGFRDETTGALGVNFNRRSWPGSPDAGFYKPHSMLWVCPPGICGKDAPRFEQKSGPYVAARSAAQTAAAKKCASRRTVLVKVKSKFRKRTRAVDLYIAGKKVKRISGAAARKPFKVVLAGRPKGSYRVDLRLSLRGGGRATDTRRFRTCT